MNVLISLPLIKATESPKALWCLDVKAADPGAALAHALWALTLLQKLHRTLAQTSPTRTGELIIPFQVHPSYGALIIRVTL